MLITEKYRDKISSVITCYDRIIIQGIIPGWSYAEGMTSYLNANKIKIFDYAAFSQPMTQKVRENAEKIAKENNIEIEFMVCPTKVSKDLKTTKNNGRIEITKNCGVKKCLSEQTIQMQMNN